MNNPVTINSSSGPHVEVWDLSDQEKIAASINNAFYYGILYPVALSGNLFTLLTVIMVLKKRKSTPNLLIGVLATSDLASLLIVHILSTVSMVGGHWIGDEKLCRFQSVVTFTYFKLGFFNKTNISMDRLIALKYPLKYKSVVTTRRVVFLIVVDLIFSIGSSALTWVMDPEYIHHLETWYLCTNDFSIYSLYKRAIVLFEGGIFILGFIGFVISDIIIVQVMLELVNRKFKHTDVRLSIKKAKQENTVPVETDVTSQNEISLPPDNEKSSDRTLTSPDVISLNQISLGNLSYDSYSQSSVTSSPILNCSNSNGKKVFKRKYIVNPKSDTKSSLEELPERYRKLQTPRSSLRGQENGLRGPGGHRGLHKRFSSKDLLSRVLSLSKYPLRQLKKDRKLYQQQKEIQYAKLVLVMVIVFVILWIPYMVTIFYEHFRQERLHPFVVDISMKLVFANAAINPILYGLFNVNYRTAYIYYCKTVVFYLTCKKTKKPSTNNLPWIKQGQDQRRMYTVAVLSSSERIALSKQVTKRGQLQ